MALCVGGFGVTNAAAQDLPAALTDSPVVAGLAGSTIVIALMGYVTYAILTSRRMKGSSLFNRLFVVVATTSAFFSAVSSAIGFSLITSQEANDFFRNALLPPAFGVFVFFLAIAVWVGGAELVRERDWFRKAGPGFAGDVLFFLERALKLFVIIPILASILFFVATWTTVVGIGGVDAVRHTYNFELSRLQTECAGITAYRQRDFLFLEELRLASENAARAARNERQGGAQSGAVGRGAVTDYIDGVSVWLARLEQSALGITQGEDPTGVSPYAPDICSTKADELKRHLAKNAFHNYDEWAREFETKFDDFVSVLNRWRHDRRVERLLEQQIANFGAANPKPIADAEGRLTAGQQAAINRYAKVVEDALESLLRKQKLAKPPVPQKSANEISPERGLEIFATWLAPKTLAPIAEEQRVSRTASVVAEEFVPGLSVITPRDAVLKNAAIFSDVWALSLAWDYAAYILMLAYLFFPSAERAAGFKD